MSKGSHGHKCKRSAYPWINAKNNRRIYLNKFIVAAAFTVGALVAMPAGAADLHVVNSSASVVRIILTNKSPDQLNKEIEAAANLVCADVNAGNDCVSEVIFDAKKQVTALTGKTLGIVGIGRIGGIVASRAQGLKMKTIAYDPFLPKDIADKIGVELVDLMELARKYLYTYLFLYIFELFELQVS